MRGRGHKKIEQEGIVKKVQDIEGRPVLNLGKRILEEIGISLNREAEPLPRVRIKKIEGKNIFGALLVIEPVPASEDDKL